MRENQTNFAGLPLFPYFARGSPASPRVLAKPSFMWVGAEVHALSYPLPSPTVSPSFLKVFRCPLPSVCRCVKPSPDVTPCLANATDHKCKPHFEGPLCGFCESGYSGADCSACPSKTLSYLTVCLPRAPSSPPWRSLRSRFVFVVKHRWPSAVNRQPTAVGNKPTAVGR